MCVSRVVRFSVWRQHDARASLHVGLRGEPWRPRRSSEGRARQTQGPPATAFHEARSGDEEASGTAREAEYILTSCGYRNSTPRPRAPSAPAAHQQKKRLRHPTYEVDVENGNGNEQLERTPTPAPVQGRTPMKGRDSYSGRGLFDELEEGLMESILDAEAEPSPR